MTKRRIRTHANPLSYPKPITRKRWISIKESNNKDCSSQKVCLDMGCGQGDFLIQSAQSNSNKLYIGIEVRQSMCEKVNNKIMKCNLTNTICLQGNASISLHTMFKPGEVNEIVINFPDPWFKEKHKKRLMIQDYVVDNMHKITSSNSKIYLQSDVEEIFNIFKEKLEKKF